ncbi:MAG: ABC transporter ATP-binding protein [Parvibaculum sp.]|uniref:ABC transporter ATP-binding protein n=1 Tax=Parvibaculum sp. TaxID=2024848 RepID=UPI001D9EAFCF|nr:ABC transporter ATP-binding protein [Parvibaculum sp.]MBX3488432.1 ABC transporter ATP-binding protein [Parvibaculum sp.]MBX3496449.1 ABC transporter ATP-binding protein [Parvibaculum sp.]MCW5727588.1 ABC transporter ATP-binding protein [Parvibaculum sp.]
MSAGGEAPVIELKGVTRILQEAVPVTLVRDIDLIIRRGEFVSVTGPSGSGKSSLLYLLGLLDLPTKGRVLIDGIDTSGYSSDRLADVRLAKLGFVFQFHFLLPEFTVLHNVTLPMQRLGRLDDDEIHARGMSLLKDFEIDDQATKRPDQLSGGQRQRVAVARALANDPAVILADEPTGNLDMRNSEIVQGIFADLAAKQGRTVIAVTHDKDFADSAPRNVHLVDGRIDSDVKR